MKKRFQSGHLVGNRYKIRNPDKRIRMGWTISKLCDQGELGGNYVANIYVANHAVKERRPIGIPKMGKL